MLVTAPSNGATEFPFLYGEVNSTMIKPANELPYTFFSPFLLAVLIYAVPAGFYVSMFGFTRVPDPQSWGLFGDFIGGVVNPGLGLITILLLLASIKTQMTEVALTREEMSKSSQALDAQVKQFDRKADNEELFKMAERTFDEVQVSLHKLTKLCLHMHATNHAPGTLESVRNEVDRCTPLLLELAHYLDRIERKSSQGLFATDYFRRRLNFAETAFVLDALLVETLKPKIDYDELHQELYFKTLETGAP